MEVMVRYGMEEQYNHIIVKSKPYLHLFDGNFQSSGYISLRPLTQLKLDCSLIKYSSFNCTLNLNLNLTKFSM